MNFQKHEHLEINFVDGVNVLYGASDIGKSCIRRAIEWIVQNENIDGVRRTNSKKTSVSITLDNDIEVERIRSQSINRYIIRKGKDEQIFDAVGKSIPNEVKELMDPDRPKDNQLTVTSATDIARSISAVELQVQVALEAIERSLGVVEVRDFIQVLTGKRGYGVSGRHRKPSDDYKMLLSFFGRTSSALERFRSNLSIEELYASRSDEVLDRERDARTVQNLIDQFNNLLEEIEVDERH